MFFSARFFYIKLDNLSKRLLRYKKYGTCLSWNHQLHWPGDGQVKTDSRRVPSLPFVRCFFQQLLSSSISFIWHKNGKKMTLVFVRRCTHSSWSLWIYTPSSSQIWCTATETFREKKREKKEKTSAAALQTDGHDWKEVFFSPSAEIKKCYWLNEMKRGRKKLKKGEMFYCISIHNKRWEGASLVYIQAPFKVGRLFAYMLAARFHTAR